MAQSPARESDPALRLRRPPCARHTRGERFVPYSALARNRTWSTTFGGSRANPAHSKGSCVGPAYLRDLRHAIDPIVSLVMSGFWELFQKKGFLILSECVSDTSSLWNVRAYGLNFRSEAEDAHIRGRNENSPQYQFKHLHLVNISAVCWNDRRTQMFPDQRRGLARRLARHSN
jgi:hypothetical protein